MVYFFCCSEEDKTGYSFQRGIGLKYTRSTNSLIFCLSWSPVCLTVTGVSTVSSLKFWAPLNARMCFWILPHLVPLQGVREQHRRQLFSWIRPGEADFEDYL